MKIAGFDFKQMLVIAVLAVVAIYLYDNVVSPKLSTVTNKETE